MCIPFIYNINITDEQVKQYALLSGDDNPIHLSEVKANKQGFKHPIVHGLLTMGLITQVASEFIRQGATISTYHMDFIAPVYLNEHLNINVHVKYKETGVHLEVINEKVKGWMVMRW